ncbi:hypothetical protein SD81_013100 [Tolypothrix campylonemoides VB511288]|nr:hypothetical protein SD81_013100 [Tolypothrix campylonemoides VB511288]
MKKRRNLRKSFRLQELFKKNCTQEAVFLSSEGQNKIASSFSGKDISSTLNFHQLKYLNLCFSLNKKLLNKSTNTHFLQQWKTQKKKSIKRLYCWVSQIITADKKVHIKRLVSFLNIKVSTKTPVSNGLPSFDWKINIFCCYA